MNIIITGASSGIGYYTAESLSKLKENKILAIARNSENLKKLKSEATHANIFIFSFDLRSEDFKPIFSEVNKFLNESEGEKIDVLINNAGLLIKKRFLDFELKDWQQTFNLNLFSTVKLIQGLYQFLNKKEGSHIVNIASMGGILGTQKFEGLSAYSASKAAVNSITESLAVEFIKDNIHVNSISPGAVQTEMLNNAFPGFKAKISPEMMGKFIADFAINSGKLLNGRLIQASLTN